MLLAVRSSQPTGCRRPSLSPECDHEPMCDIIERIEAHGIDLEQLVARKGPNRSGLSITLIVMGVVEDEWKHRLDAEPSG